MENILLPTNIEFLDTDQTNVGKVIITPCHQGYGTTLGNALRRVLLSSLPGAAIESVRIKGASHEFSHIDGVLEDVLEIILNLKKVAVKSHSDVPVILTLTKKGIGEVTVADFDKNADVELVNPEQRICTVTDDKLKFEMEVTVGKGRGYVPVEEKDSKNLDLGTILIDSLYTPIRDVGYKVDLTRVGDVTDFEKLLLTIETNGTITPKEAVVQSAKILMDHLTLILERAGEFEPVVKPAEEVKAEDVVSGEEDENEIFVKPIAIEEEDDDQETEKPAKKIKKTKKTKLTE
ncbi:MAG TPA: DNA-directed RNA polymerase subunit alpha [Candidatus Magasanikbacteria bacterium]|nr:DNA-directed RNA polymerase subunit alpha [Candidatus Magasanikbacteria bacterium]